MKVTTLASLAPGVSVAGMICAEIASTSAAWVGEKKVIGVPLAMSAAFTALSQLAATQVADRPVMEATRNLRRDVSVMSALMSRSLTFGFCCWRGRVRQGVFGDAMGRNIHRRIHIAVGRDQHAFAGKRIRHETRDLAGLGAADPDALGPARMGLRGRVRVGDVKRVLLVDPQPDRTAELFPVGE